MQTEFDVVIIGSGAGGSPIAYTLVKAGKSVLILEKGPLFRPQYQNPQGLSDFKRDELFADGPEKRIRVPGVANQNEAFYSSHVHIGTEELYYITEGEGIAYMRVGDDPATDKYPTVERQVMGLGNREFKELPVKSGSIIFTKSGGMHGIRNPGTKPLKFVAFLYHTI
ncbi:FAD-binding protein [Nostoc sp.]|uniref:FAD-binding protein n=1 Tax=Nostoc sp. TaxID=1180 RepID=UPI002FF880D5